MCTYIYIYIYLVFFSLFFIERAECCSARGRHTHTHTRRVFLYFCLTRVFFWVAPAKRWSVNSTTPGWFLWLRPMHRVGDTNEKGNAMDIADSYFSHLLSEKLEIFQILRAVGVRILRKEKKVFLFNVISEDWTFEQFSKKRNIYIYTRDSHPDPHENCT